MLLKISLGLAILVGLATLYVTHVKVGGKITDLNATVVQTQQELDVSRANEEKLTADNKVLKADLDTTARNYLEATNVLAQTRATLREQTDRANKASTQLTEVTEARNEAQRELASWRAFELSPDQIKNNLNRLKNLERDNVVLTSDNQVLSRSLASTKRQLERYTGGEEQEVILPAGTKGTIVAVDPKYDFVVLNIGGNQGVIERAKMLVNRDGKLIGKVQITAVEPNRSIANILPEWKQEGEDIMEGDQVIF